MEISFCTAPGSLRKDIGYGYAGFNIVTSLQRLGHKVPYDDKRSPVQINFSQPNWYHLRDGQYSIGYTPWESTELPPDWPELMNECDEVWTTSPICKEWFENAGVKGPIHVYQHGIESIWTPRKRTRGRKLRFLHIGEPAPRKGGQLAFDAFREAFGDKEDVHLTIKAFANSNIRVKDQYGSIIGVPGMYNNVTLNTNVLSQEELVSLYLMHDVLVYPSYGEGFGFIPLQGIATGMPSVVTEWWCPYSKYTLPLDYTLGASPWEHMHQGQVAHPSFEGLVSWYQKLYNEFERYADDAYDKAFQVHEEYNWDTLTAKAFDHIVTKFS